MDANGMADPSGRSVCSLAGIAGSNPTGGMATCLLWVLCVVKQKSLLRADHLSRGVATERGVGDSVWSWSFDNEEVLTFGGGESMLTKC